jgi:hypothetical protein
MATAPLEPELVVPELNTSIPLTTAVPSLDVMIVIAPLVELVPCPLATPTVPPVNTVLSPPAIVMWPPTPLTPVPTVRLIAPPLPPVDAPEPIEIEPVEPELEVPELNDNIPLTPLSPALDVEIVIAPLVLAML